MDIYRSRGERKQKAGRGILDGAVKYNMIEKTGAWYSYKGEKMATHITPNDPDYYKRRSAKLRQKDYAVEVSSWDFSAPNSQMIRWHWHEEIEFIYIQSGQAYITCEQDNILAYEEDIIFVNQNTKHFITPAGDNECVIRNIIVNPSFLVGYGHLDLEKKYITPVIHSTTCKYLLLSKEIN